MLFKKRCSIINFPLFWRKCCQRQAKSIGGFVLVMCEDQVFGLQAGLSLSIFEILGFRWAWVVQNLLQTGSRGFFISDVRASGFCASGGFEWCKICLGWRVGGWSQAQARHITSLRYTGGFSSPLYPISFAVVHSLLLCRGI